MTWTAEELADWNRDPRGFSIRQSDRLHNQHQRDSDNLRRREYGLPPAGPGAFPDEQREQLENEGYLNPDAPRGEDTSPGAEHPSKWVKDPTRR